MVFKMTSRVDGRRRQYEAGRHVFQQSCLHQFVPTLSIFVIPCFQVAFWLGDLFLMSLHVMARRPNVKVIIPVNYVENLDDFSRWFRSHIRWRPSVERGFLRGSVSSSALRILIFKLGIVCRLNFDSLFKGGGATSIEERLIQTGHAPVCGTLDVPETDTPGLNVPRNESCKHRFS